jgi:hypothetical protein
MEQWRHQRNEKLLTEGGDFMNTHQAGCRIKGPISFDKLQLIGRSLTRAIRRAERKGDTEHAESLFIKKAELVRRLGEIFYAR